MLSPVIRIFTAVTGLALQVWTSTYPVAPRSDAADDYHGARVADPFRPLEDMDSAATRRWVAEQSARRDAFMESSPERPQLVRRLLELGTFESFSPPVKGGARYFFTHLGPGLPQSRRELMVREPDGRTRPLAIGAAERDVLRPQVFPSPSGTLVAALTAGGQTNWLELRVVSATAEARAPEVLRGLHTTLGGISWTRDGRGFFYGTFDAPALTNPRVLYHVVGTPQESDQAIAPLPMNADWLFTHRVTEDGRYLIVHAGLGGSTRNRVFFLGLNTPGAPAPRTDAPRRSMSPLIDQGDASYMFLGNHGDRWYFYTDKDAPKGRVIAIDIRQPQADRWQTIVPEMREAIAAHDQTGGNALGMFANRFVLMYLRDGQPILRIIDTGGRVQHTIELPPAGSIWGGLVGTQSDPEVFYSFLGLVDPSTVFRLDVAHGHADVFTRATVPFEIGSVVVRQVFYTSRDGTRIPMFVLHKRGLEQNGRNPAWLYGYGALGWVSFVWYQPHILAWLEHGGVYAQPSIRGGGEYGEAWHQAGIKLQKQNAIDDYVSAAEWLVRERYTSPARLVANGGSLSSALAAAAVNERRDLFGAAILDRPVLDLLRFPRFTGGKYWEPELGTAANAEEFSVLRKLSPVHTVAPACYPPTLVMIGEHDQTAVPLHGYKYVAALQSAQTCASPVVMTVMKGAGHNFGATPEQIANSLADALAFAFRAVGR